MSHHTPHTNLRPPKDGELCVVCGCVACLCVFTGVCLSLCVCVWTCVQKIQLFGNFAHKNYELLFLVIILASIVKVFLCTASLSSAISDYKLLSVGVGCCVLGWLAAVWGFLLVDFGERSTLHFWKVILDQLCFCILPFNDASHLLLLWAFVCLFSGPGRSRTSQF